MHNGTIIAEVTKRFNARNDANSFNEIDRKAAWIETGRLWAKECRDQGLDETAKTIDKHIEWFEKNK